MSGSPRTSDLEAALGERSGEFRLMAAVLGAAVKELIDTAPDGAHPASAAHGRVLAWFRSERAGEVFTFERICDHLELDASTVRDELLRRLAVR